MGSIKTHRVFVTGYGIVSAFGNSWQECRAGFQKKENKVIYMPKYTKVHELKSYLASPILDYEPLQELTRKDKRSMGRVSLMSAHAAKLAMQSAGLISDDGSISDLVTNGSLGVSAGSSTGSTDAIVSMAKLFIAESSDCNANTYIKMMPHTIAANIAIYFHIKGRVIPTSSACTSASHAIGYSYESIKFGRIPMMIAGGGEELCMSEVYVFDSLYAASRKNSTPKLTPSPFDKDRDGLVLGEGACFLLLESEKSMIKRNALPIAEVVGYGSTCDGTHITRPQSQTMKEAMELSLADAEISPDKIGYVNAHATATSFGDIQESIATNQLFGENIYISSLKSYLGHTLGACGAMESLFSIMMMNEKTFYPTINLNEVDKECAKLNYLTDITDIDTDYVMNNNFAFGGINTSLIFKRV